MSERARKYFIAPVGVLFTPSQTIWRRLSFGFYMFAYMREWMLPLLLHTLLTDWLCCLASSSFAEREKSFNSLKSLLLLLRCVWHDDDMLEYRGFCRKEVYLIISSENKSLWFLRDFFLKFLFPLSINYNLFIIFPQQTSKSKNTFQFRLT